MFDIDMLHIRSGGRDLGLYAELGGYFSPDGRLSEPEWREFVRKMMLSPDGTGAPSGERLSPYLDQVLGYLEEKGMAPVTHELLAVAMDEAAKAGVGKLTVDPKRVQRMFTLLAAAKGNGSAADGRHDPDDKRRKILEGALAVFTEKGFHEATIDDVAAMSGVAKGTVYRYFASKEDLLDQLLIETSQKVIERFAKFFSGEADLLDEIRRFVEEWMRFIEENHALYRLIQAEGIMPHSGKRTIFYEYLLASFPMIKERIVALDSDGVLISTSFHTVVYGMLGFVDGVVHKWFRSGMSYPLRDEIPIVLEVMFNGILRRNRPSESAHGHPLNP